MTRDLSDQRRSARADGPRNDVALNVVFFLEHLSFTDLDVLAAAAFTFFSRSRNIKNAL